MRVLMIGGTGIISSACSQLAVERGMEVWLLRRGTTPKLPLSPDIREIKADIRHHPEETCRLLQGLSFDVVVDWIAYQPDEIRQDLQIFSKGVGQFIFISSAAVYQRPVQNYLILEGTPLANPLWDYARSKIACEETVMAAYRKDGFPATIVRPSYTYGPTSFPLSVNSREHPYTVADRMLRGKKIIVPGDGTSLWTLTYHTDFARGLLGLFGYSPAIGHAFHITSDEVLDWNQIYGELGKALGVEPQWVHLPSELIATAEPQRRGGLLGDKATSVVFDNSKIKRFVPGFQAEVTWAEGVRRVIRWYQQDPARCTVDEAANGRWDRLIELYEGLLKEAATLSS